MFFKLGVFKSMLKAAYKASGLTVGQVEEGYYISSGWWTIWLLETAMPKETKAAIIELCGDLPGKGEVFKAKKDFGNQYEIEQKEIYNLPEIFTRCKCNFRVTNLLGQQDDKIIRYLQAEDDTKHITAVTETFIKLIDHTAVDHDNGENEPKGPVTLCPTTTFMCWGNSVCYLMACIRTPAEGEEAFWNYLMETEVI